MVMGSVRLFVFVLRMTVPAAIARVLGTADPALVAVHVELDCGVVIAGTL
jgi:hypothetical protein